AAHLFGYVGEVNDAQVVVDSNLKSGDIVGQSGIEKVYNAMLMGEDGAKRVVVNSMGREIRTLEEDEPTEGKRLQLTIDYDVQKAIEDGFDQLGFKGAAVVVAPATGEVLGFTSRPAYDPNAFASGIDRATWASLTTDEDRPLNDRAIQGRYSPGSTFKMAVALAGLQEGIITPDFHVHCVGSAGVDGRVHGDVGQRRDAYHSASAEGGGRGRRLEADSDAATAIEGGRRPGKAAGDPRRALYGREWRRHRTQRTAQGLRRVR